MLPSIASIYGVGDFNVTWERRPIAAAVICQNRSDSVSSSVSVVSIPYSLESRPLYCLEITTMRRADWSVVEQFVDPNPWLAARLI